MKQKKVNTVQDIPFEPDELYFFKASDQPDKAAMYQVIRQGKADNVVFIGEAPDWISEMIMTGHRVFELPGDAEAPHGRWLMRPHQTPHGIRWVADQVGISRIDKLF